MNYDEIEIYLVLRKISTNLIIETDRIDYEG